MHIERILLRNVGPFDDVTIELPEGTDPKLADVYLLTGPNGTGKSTILYALAAVLGSRTARNSDGASLGRELLSTRLRTTASLVALRTDEGQTLAAAPQGYPGDVRDPFGDAPLFGSNSGQLIVLETMNGRPLYANLAAALRADAPPELRTRFGWAAFAYAALRSVTDVQIEAVREPKSNPFENSLSFVETADTGQLANWIVSQNFRRLKAKEAGHDERADQFARSVRDIEAVVAEIIGDPEFAFVITDEDDNVRIRWNGAVVRLGLLPDGLKSIISWVADLLMRLDRIPWQDETPVLQRSFLLLLDEVDLHLHPAWQRKVLPLVQRVFPNAQIIASTHSPFVVTSVDDARIISLGLQGQSSVVTDVAAPQIGTSYTAVLRSIFGIDSEFDVDTEQNLAGFHAAKQRLLSGDAAAKVELDRLADLLARRSEELRELIALELGQLRRQQALRVAP